MENADQEAIQPRNQFLANEECRICSVGYHSNTAVYLTDDHDYNTKLHFTPNIEINNNNSPQENTINTTEFSIGDKNDFTDGMAHQFGPSKFRNCCIDLATGFYKMKPSSNEAEFCGADDPIKETGWTSEKRCPGKGYNEIDDSFGVGNIYLGCHLETDMNPNGNDTDQVFDIESSACLVDDHSNDGCRKSCNTEGAGEYKSEVQNDLTGESEETDCLSRANRNDGSPLEVQDDICSFNMPCKKSGDSCLLTGSIQAEVNTRLYKGKLNEEISPTSRDLKLYAVVDGEISELKPFSSNKTAEKRGNLAGKDKEETKMLELGEENHFISGIENYIQSSEELYLSNVDYCSENPFFSTRQADLKNRFNSTSGDFSKSIFNQLYKNETEPPLKNETTPQSLECGTENVEEAISVYLKSDFDNSEDLQQFKLIVDESDNFVDCSTRVCNSNDDMHYFDSESGKYFVENNPPTQDTSDKPNVSAPECSKTFLDRIEEQARDVELHGDKIELNHLSGLCSHTYQRCSEPHKANTFFDSEEEWMEGERAICSPSSQIFKEKEDVVELMSFRGRDAAASAEEKDNSKVIKKEQLPPKKEKVLLSPTEEESQPAGQKRMSNDVPGQSGPSLKRIKLASKDEERSIKMPSSVVVLGKCPEWAESGDKISKMNDAPCCSFVAKERRRSSSRRNYISLNGKTTGEEDKCIQEHDKLLCARVMDGWTRMGGKRGFSFTEVMNYLRKYYTRGQCQRLSQRVMDILETARVDGILTKKGKRYGVIGRLTSEKRIVLLNSWNTKASQRRRKYVSWFEIRGNLKMN